MAKCGENSFNRKKSKAYIHYGDEYLPKGTPKFAKPETIKVKHNITASGLHLLKNKTTGRLEQVGTQDIPKKDEKRDDFGNKVTTEDFAHYNLVFY